MNQLIRKNPATLLTALFLVCAFSFLVYQRIHKPRIFVLHSYSKSMPWVQGLNKGIQKQFKDKRYVSIRYFYMNTKKHHSKSYLKRISRVAYHAIMSWKPDIVIVFDEYAQKLVATRLAKHSRMKVIMGGITDHFSLYPLAARSNVTGVLEQIPVAAIKEIATLIFHHKKRIYYLSDDSATAKRLDQNIINSNWGSFHLVEHKRVKTWAQWKQAVKEAGKKADILLVSVYQTITNGKRQVSPKKLVRWMNKNSEIPVIGIYESFIIDGGWIAIAVSSVEQGVSVAWLAANILEHKLDIAELPFVKSKTFSLYIRKFQVRRRFPYAHIPVILRAFSKESWRLNNLVTKPGGLKPLVG